MHMRMADDNEFCVSDEEFWESLAGKDMNTQGLVEYEDRILPTRPYKFDFGKHRGLTFDEVPVAYIDWLVQNGINVDRENFRAALDEYRGTQKAKVQPLSPTSQNAKRKRSFSGTGLPPSPAIVKKQRSSPQDSAFSKDDCHIAQAAGPSSNLYRLTFGKHTGKTLEELPSSYIEWLLKNGILKSNPGLASALKKKAHSRLVNWTKPNPQDTHDPRFFDRDTNAALWIAKTDAEKYFNVDVHLLGLAKIWPIVKRSQSYCLYSIYVCAKHFRTVTEGTADQALAKFLNKNRDREREIVAGMGCFCPYCCGKDSYEDYVPKLSDLWHRHQGN